MSAQKEVRDHDVEWPGPDAVMPRRAQDDVCRLRSGPGTRPCLPTPACPRACVGFPPARRARSPRDEE